MINVFNSLFIYGKLICMKCVDKFVAKKKTQFTSPRFFIPV